jgi:hypothetical protein
MDRIWSAARQVQLLLLYLLCGDLEGLVSGRRRRADGMQVPSPAPRAVLTGLDQGPAGPPALHEDELAPILGRDTHAIGHGLADDPRQAERALRDRAVGDAVGLRGVALDRDLLVERIGQQPRLADREARQPGVADIGHVARLVALVEGNDAGR